MPQLDPSAQRKQAERESAAIIAFTSAVAAYGAFFIPKAYGTSIAMTGSPVGALWAFLVFYVICLLVTWVFYARPGGLLYAAERRQAQQSKQMQTA
jgi:NNP family nitrate/nitrite transporter-like MFS transporter